MNTKDLIEGLNLLLDTERLKPYGKQRPVFIACLEMGIDELTDSQEQVDLLLSSLK